MHFELSIINGRTVFDIVRAHRRECIQIVREAYLAHADGRSVNPDSHFLRFPEKPDCRIIALPAYLGNGFDVAGLKWIASYPANIERGFPRASAILVLNSYDTGYPFAILESSIISAARTAASAVLAAHWLSGQSRRAHSLGIVGTGFIARYVYDFLVDTGWAIEEVRLYDRSPLESEKFSDTVCRLEQHRTVTVVPDVAQLVSACDLIVFTTVTPAPHVFDATLFEHNPLVLHISLRDLAPEILLKSQNVVDDVLRFQEDLRCKIAKRDMQHQRVMLEEGGIEDVWCRSNGRENDQIARADKLCHVGDNRHRAVLLEPAHGVAEFLALERRPVV